VPATDADVLVVGGGVIGLAIARSLLVNGRDVLLIEQNARLGAEITSRNSEVIHAGLYYTPQSLRARLCIAGRRKLVEFAKDRGVAIVRCGKILVATSEGEVATLASIMEVAKRNGVDDLEMLTASEARNAEPELSCVSACLSPSTSVIDSHGLILALDADVKNLGGSIVLNTAATAISKRGEKQFSIGIRSVGDHSEITAESVVLACGLWTAELARTLAYPQSYDVPATYYAKGHYFTLPGRSPFAHLIYPVTTGSWLGVHFTRDVSGKCKFGPDFEWCPDISYDFRNGVDARRSQFEREIRRYWPNLPTGLLQPDYIGIRPKISRDMAYASDFAIHDEKQHGLAGLIALYGIDSPGLTSALAIGDYVAERLPH
jgi:L-2-hydroxyglutarate oxidase LhgO